MNKILIELYLPASGATYDVRIPAGTRIGELIPLLENALADMEYGYYIPDSNTVLCDRNTGVVLDVNLTANEMGIINGARLMLI